MKTVLRIGILVSLTLVIPALLSAQKIPRTIFVNATDAAGAPVLDLAQADFEVNEGGAARTVTKASLANGPMRIVLIVDTTAGADRWRSGVKTGLTAFVEAIPQPHEIAVVTIGAQFRVHAQPMTDRVKLKDTVNKLGSDGGGNVLLDGLRESESRFMKKEGVRWPVYVILTTDSALDTSMRTEDVNKMFDDILSRGTTVHAVVMQNSGPTVTTEIANNLTKNTGGSYEFLTTVNNLQGKLTELGSRIAQDHQKMSTRYQIEYVSEATAGAAIAVGIRRPGVSKTVSFRRPF